MTSEKKPDIWFHLYENGTYARKFGSIASYIGWRFFNPSDVKDKIIEVDHNQ